MTDLHPQVPPKALFGKVDEAPVELQEQLVRYLDGAAGHPAIQEIRLVAEEALGLTSGQRVLDAGCGLGEVARGMASRVLPGGSVDAIDASASMIEVARSRTTSTAVRYAVGDVTALGFEDGTFDAVRSERVLQHLAEPDRAVAELVRVTRPGGRICLIDTDWESMTFDGLPLNLLESLRMMMAEHGQSMRQPAMGRTLRRRLHEAGVVELECHPVTLSFTDPADATVVIPLFSADFVQMVFPPELTAPWLRAVDAAAARDELLAALTIWVVAGNKPVSV